MRLMPLLIFNVVFAPAALAADGQAWAYVPAGRDSQSILGFVLPVPPAEGVVTLVRGDRLAAVRQSVPGRVFAIEISDLRDRRVDILPSYESTASAVPAEAHWPDAHGRIVVLPSEQR